MMRIVLLIGAAAVAAVSLLLGGALSDWDADGPQAANRLGVRSPVSLGLTYQQRARETGDPTYYPLAERAFREALLLEPTDALALAGLGALASSRHRFDEARALARRALAINPHSAATWGILGDAQLETGRYRAAIAAFDRMIAIKPTASAYARISYAREILGRTGPAIAAMKRAVTASAAIEEHAAWSRVQLGNLYAETGRLGQAEYHYRAALAFLPRYGPALGAVARIRAWQGRHAEAVRLWRRALGAQTVPEHAVGLGDSLAALGQTTEAEQAYAESAQLEAAFAANGGQNQLETALFDLDHGHQLADALARARVGQRLRPSVEGEHVLAWALYKNGRCEEARVHSVRALRLGTKDWGAMLHRSLIELCLGNREAARSFRQRALDVNRYALAAFGPLEAHRSSRGARA